MLKDIKYFKGLDALRFFAAYLVVLHHAEQIRMKYSLFNLKEYSLFNNGSLAVTFFFVLSGFLISYLLFRENGKKQNIVVSKFYYRRILRIWPLYFLIVIVGVFILPFILDFIGYNYLMPYSYKDVILYYIFFSPFMVNILFGHHLIEPLWSIGVEELFYILWAPLFKFLNKYILQIIIFVIVIRSVLLYASFLGFFNSTFERLIGMLRFEAMAIGGLGAYCIYHYKDFITSFVFSRITQIVFMTFILLRFLASRYLTLNSDIFYFLFRSPVFSDLFIMLLFCWLIINISLNPRSIISLDSKILSFLGTISYGVYMYHMFIIFGILVFMKDVLLSLDDFTSTVLFYSLLTIIVILVSYLSKKLFEDYFLSFKKKFRVIE